MTDNFIFVDSNIWLYAFMSAESKKTKKAEEIISNSNIILSTQIINEICVNLIKKAGYSEPEIQQAIKNIYGYYQVVPIDEETIIEASIIRSTHQLSYWDSLVVVSAITSKCTILYSEDMQHNQIVQGVKIVNPFIEII
ncbi:PIN domain-containing protein [Candidatus Thiosymbion oneisti]|uniref:PIN domain-containing protein n=1 Tax=Candidatus Thiosymbion oneisti TaxID=589554 RepID=UPI000B7D3689|nr:PIN domain-containing protein [Candidatus Thiosymbion oneisti]